MVQLLMMRSRSAKKRFAGCAMSGGSGVPMAVRDAYGAPSVGSRPRRVQMQSLELAVSVTRARIGVDTNGPLAGRHNREYSPNWFRDPQLVRGAHRFATFRSGHELTIRRETR